MTFDEAVARANQGDLDSILALGRYYFGDEAAEENKDIEEAIKWYEKGAEFGYPNCMYLAAILLTLNGHVLRKIGSASAAEDALKSLNRGYHWAIESYNHQVADAYKQIITIKGEMGIAYFLWGFGDEYTHPTQQQSLERYIKAINLLKEVYTCTDDNEVYIYLAFSLNAYGEIVGYNDNESNRLEFSLYHKCADDLFGNVIHSDLAAYYLGQMYAEGRGCAVDYNQSYFYFQKAHNAGFDCSDVLKRFKKKMFGGYTLR